MALQRARTIAYVDQKQEALGRAAFAAFRLPPREIRRDDQVRRIIPVSASTSSAVIPTLSAAGVPRLALVGNVQGYWRADDRGLRTTARFREMP